LGQTATAEKIRIDGDLEFLSFGIQKSRRYHERLCAFYQGWRDAMKIVAVISGSGAFFLIFSGQEHVAGIISAFVAMWAILDIIAGPDKKSDIHGELAKRFTMLGARLAAAKPDIETYNAILAERYSIEADEPPCKRIIDIISRNDECRARDYSADQIAPISTAQRYLGYFFTFGMGRLERWKEQQQRDHLVDA
jgi:hypothetical protein